MEGQDGWLTAKLRTRKRLRICNHLIESELQAGMVVGISTLDVPDWDQIENECIKGSETWLLVASKILGCSLTLDISSVPLIVDFPVELQSIPPVLVG